MVLSFCQDKHDSLFNPSSYIGLESETKVALVFEKPSAILTVHVCQRRLLAGIFSLKFSVHRDLLRG